MQSLNFSKPFYSKKAVQDTVYWLSEKYVISVKETEDSFCIESDDLNDSFIKEFTAKLNDFNLRSELENKSQELKSLIIAKAFYPEMISIEPTGKFEDPVMMDNNDKAK